MFGVECILDLDRYILDADGIDGRGIDDLGTKVTQLHSLYIRQLIDGIGAFNHLRVSRHEAVDIRPDFQHLGIQHGSNDGCGVVASATSQVRGLVAVAVAGNEAGNDIDMLVVDVLESLLHQRCRQVGIDDVLAFLVPGTDKVTRVHANTVLNHCSDDMRAQAFTIRDDGVGRLLTQVVNEVHTVEDTLQLVEELV